MEHFKFFALGGIGDVGKNMYVFETEKDLYVLDCGAAAPSSQVNGYDALVPDYSYVIEHKDKLRGIFITRFGEKTSGALIRIVKDLSVPFYCSPFTCEAIKRRYFNQMDDKGEGVDLRVINSGEILEFEDSKIESFSVTTSVPDTFAYVIKVDVSETDTPIWKNCVFAPDCDFDQNIWGHFRTDFKTLARIADEGVIVLFSPSAGAPRTGHVTTDGALDIALRKLMAKEGREFILMDAENISGILQVIDAAYVQKRRITIIGHKARHLVELAMEMNYTRVNQNLYMKKEILDDEKRNADDTVVIIAGDQMDTFRFMEGIATYQDKHYKLKSTDSVAMLLETPKKYEKLLASIWNDVWFNNATIVDFDVSLMPNPVAGQEDLKLLYSILSPEYIIPISGDYRMLVAQERVALDYGIQPEKIINLENGMIAEFEGSKLINDPEKTEKIDTKEILFGNEIDSDINDFVAREREALTQEGFLVISGMINLKEREIYGDIEIATSGFLPEFGQEEEIKSIKEEFKEIVNTHLKMRKVDYKDLRQELKNSLSKKILKDTKKRPILIPIIIDISGSNQQIDTD